MKRNYFLAFIVLFLINFSACSIQNKELPDESTSVTSLELETATTAFKLKSVYNARQIGGYSTNNSRTVKQNAILRSGELYSLSDEEKKLLINEYKLTHIIDLRDEVETENSPDPVIKGAEYHHFNVWKREVRTRLIEESTTIAGFDSDLFVKNYYTAFALDPSAVEAYRNMFEVLLENEEGSVLIHCVHGKDRTGIAVTLLLSALGADWASIEREYLLSNAIYEGSVDISSLRHYKSVIEENYGSMENYLKTEMNLAEQELNILQDKYTIPE